MRSDFMLLYRAKNRYERFHKTVFNINQTNLLLISGDLIPRIRNLPIPKIVGSIGESRRNGNDMEQRFRST